MNFLKENSQNTLQTQQKTTSLGGSTLKETKKTPTKHGNLIFLSQYYMLL